MPRCRKAIFDFFPSSLLAIDEGNLLTLAEHICVVKNAINNVYKEDC